RTRDQDQGGRGEGERDQPAVTGPPASTRRRSSTAGTPPRPFRYQAGQGRERQAHDSDDELGAGTVHHEDYLGGPCGQRGTQQPQVERRRRRPRPAHQSVTCARSFSSVASPMPLTSSSSSGWVNRP